MWDPPKVTCHDPGLAQSICVTARLQSLDDGFPLRCVCRLASVSLDLKIIPRSVQVMNIFLLSALEGDGENPQSPQSLRFPAHPSPVGLRQRAHGDEERVLRCRLQKRGGFPEGEVSLLVLKKITVSFFRQKHVAKMHLLEPHN